MLSIVVSGRNDAFGYNSHKRVAISLNCFAEHLDDDGDEIVFVDYNTPDTLPTLPEALADTLTQRTRARLRVLRIRPALHNAVAVVDNGGILDVIARNAGLRRTNAANRWILQTTTDMVLVPRDPDARLTAMLARLPDGFYPLPRFEVPQLSWESFDRTDPNAIIATLRDLADQLHLREAVVTEEPVTVDNCGDFQLMLRDDLFAVHGMDERMTFGWQHSDANLHTRLRLHRGIGSGLDARLDAYHCSHGRTVAATQQRARLEHDWDVFVSSVAAAALPQQAETWGLAGVPLEEIRLAADGAPERQAALAQTIGRRQQALLVARRQSATHDGATVPVEHVLPHVADQLVSLDPRAPVGYLGANRDLLARLARLTALWGRPPLVALRAPFATLPPLSGDAAIRWSDSAELADTVAIVVDFSVAADDAGTAGWIAVPNAPEAARRALANVRERWLEIVAVERRRHAEGTLLRPIIIVNAIHTTADLLIDATTTGGYTPFSTRTRVGTVAAVDGPALPTSADLVRHVASRLGREPSSQDISLALTALFLVCGGAAVAAVPDRMINRALLALLDHQKLMARLRVAPDVLEALRRRARKRLALTARAIRYIARRLKARRPAPRP
jgi:hypothetical protein